ncbi:hypothetical protein [Sphingomonas sp. 3-13AW]|uniref:hypothetical protein n=1 Tax=Sphingomonas sp. 3-13AW TaxID=3050450 RepID=UPI003BB65656
MKDKATPPAALAALRSLTGALFRHGPDGSREYLSLATRLETGMWAGVEDRGIYPGSVYGKFCGTEVVVDLYLHLIAGDGSVIELPVQWAMRTTFRPIALLGVPGDVGETPQIASTAEMTWPQYRSIHRPDLPGFSRFGTYVPRAETTFELPVEGVKGSIYEPPLLQPYRYASDERAAERITACVSADFDYPSDIHIGCPTVDDAGRLVGVTVGIDPGSERSHVGLYVPADFLTPMIALAHASKAAMRRRDRSWTGIELVKFWNSDVMFDDEFEAERRPAHYQDQLVKAVLPRKTWHAIIDQAETVSLPDRSAASNAALDALKSMVSS